MRFRYPLQKVVDLKGNEKSMAEWEYAASLGRLREEEARLGGLLEERKAVEERIAAAAASSVTLSELASLQLYLDALEEKIRRQRRDVESAESAVLLRRSKLAEKSVEEKVWLKARDKAFEAFKQEWLSRQQNELDDIAAVRAAYSRS